MLCVVVIATMCKSLLQYIETLQIRVGVLCVYKVTFHIEAARGRREDMHS